MTDLLAPWQYEFFQRGMLIAAIAGALCGMVGVYVVLRGMSYIGHGLSHAVTGGAVASYVMGINVIAGAGAFGVLAALMIQRVARRRIIGADAAIGVVTTAAFAMGLALISRFRGFTRNFEALLFGNVLGVTWADVLTVGVALAAAGAVVFLRYRQLLFSTFDPEVADVSGVSTARTDALLAILLAGTITATMQILGVLLVAAALVIPAVIGRLLTDSFARMLGLSTAVGAVGGLTGMYLSYYLNVSSGATIVLAEAALFVVAFLVSGARVRRLAAAGAAGHIG